MERKLKYIYNSKTYRKEFHPNASGYTETAPVEKRLSEGSGLFVYR